MARQYHIMKFQLCIVLAISVLVLSVAGCSRSNHVDKAECVKEMTNLADNLKYKGQATVFWPYHQNDSALLFKIGNGGNNNVDPSFYGQIDKTEAVAIHALFTKARRKSGFSGQNSQKCQVYVCDDSGKILCFADENGVHQQ